MATSGIVALLRSSCRSPRLDPSRLNLLQFSRENSSPGRPPYRRGAAAARGTGEAAQRVGLAAGTGDPGRAGRGERAAPEHRALPLGAAAGVRRRGPHHRTRPRAWPARPPLRGFGGAPRACGRDHRPGHRAGRRGPAGQRHPGRGRPSSRPRPGAAARRAAGAPQGRVVRARPHGLRPRSGRGRRGHAAAHPLSPARRGPGSTGRGVRGASRPGGRPAAPRGRRHRRRAGTVRRSRRLPSADRRPPMTAETVTPPPGTELARPARRALFAIPAAAALFTGLDGALSLLGVWSPIPGEGTAEAHGVLMTVGFVGTLIALERAVAARRRAAFCAPALLSTGALLMLAPHARDAGALL